jgi:hypothetical protein
MTTALPARNRRQLLLAPGATFNGIDYVSVAPDQTGLLVHFLNAWPVQGTLYGQQVTITGGDAIPSVAVDPVDEATAWSVDSEGRPVLAVTVAAPGDFSTYQLTVLSDELDPVLSTASFTFKANCPTAFDCATAAPAASLPAAAEPVPIDYLAKDFASFRQALSEFSTLRYPAWVERSEADLGVMLMEALAAMADELSYYQDRVAVESALPTATQRLSVTRHARLVDYEPAPATVATTVLALDVTAPGSPPQDTSWTIGSPLLVRALSADGTITDFETEDPATGLASPGSFTVDVRWNRAGLVPYYWDDSQRLLQAGSTGFYLTGQGLGLYQGQLLLLDTPAADSADPPVRELVTVAATQPASDQLIGADGPPPQPLTQVTLQAPTTKDHDLALTEVAGNIVPAVQGLRQSETFAIPDPALPAAGPVVVRAGAGSTPQDPRPDYRYCLAAGPLAWLATDVQSEDTAVIAAPEILLSAASPGGEAVPWTFQRWLLGAASADQVFTLTPEQYSPVLTSNGMTWYDYDGDGGSTIRFGDGTFGASPAPGTVFTVVYRTGGGAAGNVPADTIVNVAPGQALEPLIVSCTNPFPAAGGADAETIAQVRTQAPEKFSAEPLRVVRAQDYAATARSLPWVQQAGTTFRWTGSWLTALTSANPVGSGQPTIAQLEALTALLGQQRLAGYESYVLPPAYVSVDLQITVRGQPAALGSDVAAAVLAALAPGPGPGGTSTAGTGGFFDHSRWSFGQPLESSALLAAIQGCPGVAGVSQVQYRRRGAQDWAPLPGTLTVAADQILRVDNDPSRPEAGSLQVTVEGAQ